jgi:hypothetical protein
MLTIQKINGIQFFLLNNLIKIDLIHGPIITRLKDNKLENYSFNNEEKLWYFQNYKKKNKLIDILYPNEKIITVKFKNNDFNDYLESNLILTKDIKFKDEFNTPNNVKIINIGPSIKITDGKYAGQFRNKYWEIEGEKNYIIMHIKDNIYTKFSKKDELKVLLLNNKRPIWYLHENGYIGTTIRINSETYFYYLHQLIMDQHTKDNTDYKNTVDHINQDKLDNRRENLRIVNMSEQNKNKGKQERRIDAKTDLPIDIKILPKYVEYRKEIYNKENNSHREFFIVSHPKLDKSWETTKSNKISIQDKFKHATSQLDLIENKITEEQFKKIIGLEDKMDLPLGIRLEIFREKYHYILDWRNNDKRYNAKMILHSTDIQKELDKFIDIVVNIKYPNFMKKYEIKNLINIDNELISKETQKEINIEKIPTYPKGITVYKDKDSFYIQYSKNIDKKRYGKKNKINSKDIQKELDKLIDDINEKYPNLNLEKQKVINPELFTF